MGARAGWCAPDPLGWGYAQVGAGEALYTPAQRGSLRDADEEEEEEDEDEDEDEEMRDGSTYWNNYM